MKNFHEATFNIEFLVDVWSLAKSWLIPGIVQVTTCSNLRTKGYGTLLNITDPTLVAYGDTIERK